MFSFFLSKNKNWIVFVFLMILSLSFMSFSSTRFSLTFKEVGETLIYPFRISVIKIFSGISSLVTTYNERQELKEQLALKELELSGYRERFQKYTDLLTENERLRSLLGYRQKEHHDVMVAEIIGRDPESNFSSLTLNRGRKDGVLPNMPVFAYMDGEKGVVGIIAESGIFTSKVKTFRNRDFSLGVYLPQSKVHGVAQGLGDNKNIMSLLYIDKETSIVPKESIVSSIEGDLFPPDFFLGTLSYIDTTDKTRLTHKIYLKPYIQFSKIKDVFIIKKTPKILENNP